MTKKQAHTPREQSTESAPRPIVALITDFGQNDWFVGSMKGSILRLCPNATIVDHCHYIRSGEILHGAWLLAQTRGDFPAGTVFCVVVDPGVGTERRALVARDEDYTYVAPDNGLLTTVQRQAKQWRAHAVMNPAWMRDGEISRTFHGRDIFAPAAAHCLLGHDIADAGPVADTIQTIPSLAPTRGADGSVTTQVVHIDRFGNLILNFARHHVAELGLDGDVTCRIGNREIAGIKNTFGSVQPGELVMYWGSLGCLELAVNQGSAAIALSASIGDEARLSPLDPHAAAQRP